MCALKQEGLLSGLKAFLFRYNNCRKGYEIKLEREQLILITAKNQRIEKKDIRPSIIDAYYDSVHLHLLSKSSTDSKFTHNKA